MNDELKAVAQQAASTPEQVRQALEQDLSQFSARVAARPAPTVAPPAAPAFVETTQQIDPRPLRTTSGTDLGSANATPSSIVDLWIAEDGELHSYAVSGTDQGVITP